MKILISKLWPLCVFSISLCSAFSQAEEARIGSHLDSDAIPSMVVQLNKVDEVERIRQLLSDGRNVDALEKAEEYIIKVEKITLVNETSKRYYAYNALCSVQTSLGYFDEAISSCETAMSLEPEKWSAINNRGTVNLVSGKLNAAIEDYQLALMKVPEGNVNVVATIEHNIRLAESRRL